jgi:hypothetical protein
MSPSTDPKRVIGARVHAKAHFAMSMMDAKRTFGSAWNTYLVSGAVLSVVERASGKRVSVHVDVMWDLPAGPKARVVNVRSVTAGNAPGAVEPEAGASAPAAGQFVGADPEQDSERRQPAPPAYSEAGSPAPPDLGDNLATTRVDGTRNTVGRTGSVGAGYGTRFAPHVVD